MVPPTPAVLKHVLMGEFNKQQGQQGQDFEKAGQDDDQPMGEKGQRDDQNR